jgi:hypothetical protein
LGFEVRVEVVFDSCIENLTTLPYPENDVTSVWQMKRCADRFAQVTYKNFHMRSFYSKGLSFLMYFW